MGCRCNERSAALGRAMRAVARGDAGTVKRSLGFVGRTFAEDARSGALRQAATQKLAQLRQAARRR